jgi:hypothetical protein
MGGVAAKSEGCVAKSEVSIAKDRDRWPWSEGWVAKLDELVSKSEGGEL